MCCRVRADKIPSVQRFAGGSRDQKSGVIGKHRSWGIERVHGSNPRDFDQKENLLKMEDEKKQCQSSDNECNKADKRVCTTQLSTAPIGESPVAQLN